MTVKLRRINSAALVASKIATGSSTTAVATEPQCSAVPQDRQTSNHTSHHRLSNSSDPHQWH